MTLRWRVVVIAAVLLAGPRLWAQDSDRPREFTEFRGTWILDETATEGLRQTRTRLGQTIAIDALGFQVARTVIIATSPTGISLTKDAGLPEVYRFDGTETQTRDPRTGAALQHRYSFALVSELLALTAKRPRCCGIGGTAMEIITDAYGLMEWDVLRVERQLSYVTAEGSLRTLARQRSAKQTIIYRRAPEPRSPRD